MKIEHINPDGLMMPRGFTQVITVSGSRKTIYVGGQDSVNDKGETVGKGDLKKQTEQVLDNIEIALTAAGAKFENVVKLSVYLVQGQDPREGFEVFQRKWGGVSNPPTITVLFVAGLGNPEWLVEIDAIAVASEE